MTNVPVPTDDSATGGPGSPLLLDSDDKPSEEQMQQQEEERTSKSITTSPNHQWVRKKTDREKKELRAIADLKAEIQRLHEDYGELLAASEYRVEVAEQEKGAMAEEHEFQQWKTKEEVEGLENEVDDLNYKVEEQDEALDIVYQLKETVCRLERQRGEDRRKMDSQQQARDQRRSMEMAKIQTTMTNVVEAQTRQQQQIDDQRTSMDLTLIKETLDCLQNAFTAFARQQQQQQQQEQQQQQQQEIDGQHGGGDADGVHDGNTFCRQKTNRMTTTT